MPPTYFTCLYSFTISHTHRQLVTAHLSAHCFPSPFAACLHSQSVVACLLISLASLTSCCLPHSAWPLQLPFTSCCSATSHFSVVPQSLHTSHSLLTAATCGPLLSHLYLLLHTGPSVLSGPLHTCSLSTLLANTSSSGLSFAWKLLFGLKPILFY